MNKKYDAFVFDLYGTLVDIHTNEAKGYLWQKIAMFFSLMGADYSPHEFKRTYKFLCKEESKKNKSKLYEIDLRNVFEKLFALKNVEVSEDTVLASMINFRTLSLEYIRLYPGAVELLNRLKDSGKKVILLSNAQADFTLPELNSLGITGLFDDIYISSKEGYKKPSQDFYNNMINKSGIDRNHSIMIGNDIECDIIGAKEALLDTFYIHSNISPKDDKLVDSPADYSYEMEDAYSAIIEMI